MASFTDNTYISYHTCAILKTGSEEIYIISGPVRLADDTQTTVAQMQVDNADSQQNGIAVLEEVIYSIRVQDSCQHSPKQ